MDCAILEEPLCRELSKDSFTIITNGWASLQLVWTTMLIFVHLMQIARAVTTYETMRGQTQVGPLMAAITAGTTSSEGAQINGPDGTKPGHKKKEGCFTQWSRLLGLDTFMTIAFQGYKGSQEPRAPRPPKNPFTRGVLRNCQDFWMEGPVFGKKVDSNKALLGGEVVDYACMYDIPKGGMRYRGGGYEAVPGAEEEV